MIKNSELKDYYAVCFDGQVRLGGSWVPLTSVGMVKFDGAGGLWLLNRVLCAPTSGYAPEAQHGEGTYNVEAYGIGTATLEVHTGANSFTTETFRFVVNADLSELQFISTKTDFHIKLPSDALIAPSEKFRFTPQVVETLRRTR